MGDTPGILQDAAAHPEYGNVIDPSLRHTGRNELQNEDGHIHNAGLAQVFK